MASQFHGLHMRVILREPPGLELSGVVQNVEAGNSLTLVNVFIPTTNETRPHVLIDAANIADLSEMRASPSPLTFSNPGSQPTRPPAMPPAPSQSSYVDPAIMSFDRHSDSHSQTPTIMTPRQPTGPGGDWGLLFGRTDSQPTVAASARTGSQPTIVASATEALKNVQLNENVFEGSDSHQTGEAAVEDSVDSKKKKRVRTRRPKQHGGSHLTENQHPVSPSKDSPTAGHGPGWRQTPLLQSTSSFQPFHSLKDKRRRGGKSKLDGWASEDVTEEMGEFDFENNLAKFDKHTIFDQMRREDQVDEESRLVFHNRRPKPGTAGGKNLHYTEMVLDVPSTAALTTDYWNSEADVAGDNEDDGGGAGGGGEAPGWREARNGQLTHRANSKSGVSRRSQSRKASGGGNVAAVGGLPLSRVNSSARVSQSPRRTTPGSDHRRPNAPQQPPAVVSVSAPAPAPASREGGLFVSTSGRRVETISALQMLTLENVAANEIGFTEELMAENAGRGVAEVAIKALSDPAMKLRFELASSNGGASAEGAVSSATIVILAGNNKSSIRALAAARHLRNKNLSVVVCLVGIEREKELLEDLRRQISLYRNFGGKVLRSAEFFEHMRGVPATGATRITVSLIVDALLGLNISFDELRIGDQATVYELMGWANRNEAFVLAIDVPTGIDPASGQIANIDGSRQFIKPRYVVAMGAPKRGLLEAVRPAEDDESGAGGTGGHAAQDEEWQLFLADIGVGSTVWKKAGAKARRGIEFDGKWVLEMEYRGAEEPEDEDDD